jgi:predicted methyltransferase
MQKLNPILSLSLLALLTTTGSVAFANPVDSERLASVLAAQPEMTRERYQYRHPHETLDFFGLAPGATVVEALPGGGWYSKILLAYLGKEGHLIGADYAHDMYPLFGFFSEQRIEEKKTWVSSWTAEAEGWRSSESATVSAFQLGSMPEDIKGSVDAVLFIRALHNLNRFESQGGYLTAALKDAHDALKPGGILGVVQHHARPEKTDEWAGGQRGYLKKESVIKTLEKAGFEYLSSSDINANAADQPGDDDVVWRLGPTFATSRDNPELKEKLAAIGESNRMTLKFRKPE